MGFANGTKPGEERKEGFVSSLRDMIVNIPSMPFAYVAAVFVEVLRTFGVMEQPTPPEPVWRNDNDGIQNFNGFIISASQFLFQKRQRG